MSMLNYYMARLKFITISTSNPSQTINVTKILV